MLCLFNEKIYEQLVVINLLNTFALLDISFVFQHLGI